MSFLEVSGSEPAEAQQPLCSNFLPNRAEFSERFLRIQKDFHGELGELYALFQGSPSATLAERLRVLSEEVQVLERFGEAFLEMKDTIELFEQSSDFSRKKVKAAFDLRFFDHKEAEAILYEQGLRARDAIVRAVSARSLGHHASAESEAALCSCGLTDPAFIVREAAARALRLQGGTRARDALIRALELDSASEVRIAAAKSLAVYPDHKSTSALIDFGLNDQHGMVRRAAFSTLLQRSDDERVAQLLKERNDYRRPA